jgi:acyl-CoA thioester hydrolase
MATYQFDYVHRVRYRECDPMGVVYHTHFVDYFEASRTEALRDMGLAYKALEDRGVILPVVNLGLQFKRPAHYDDVLVIRSMFTEPPTSSLTITYEVRRKGDETVLVTGHVTLCFVDAERRRPIRAPDDVQALFVEALHAAA